MGTTSPDGISYPDSNYPMNNWWDAFAEMAASIQAARTAERAWNSWTPIWNTPSDGGILSVGAGGLNEGFWRKDNGKMVDAQFRIRLGTAPSVQAGLFTLILPVPAYVWGSGTEAITTVLGTWAIRDDSTAPVSHFGGPVVQNDPGGLRISFGSAPAAGTPFQSIRRVDSTDPTVLAVNDVFTANLHYRAA